MIGPLLSILGSSYLSGAESSHLEDIYELEDKTLEPWRDSPGEISTHDWREYLGKKEYQRAYVDFFEDQLPLLGYDWKKLLEKYLFEGKEPLFNNLICGLGHPLIHLGYAYELQSREVAMEGLSLATTCYNFLHKYLDDPSYSKPPQGQSKTSLPLASTFDLLKQIREDSRFDNIPASADMETLFKTHEAAVLEYWNAWRLSDNLRSQFEESQSTPVALLVGSVDSDGGKTYDFFLVHLLTSSHAVRIILPMIPPKWHETLVRQWWLFVVAVYIGQGRPAIDLNRFVDKDIGKRDWKWVSERAIHSHWSSDAHFVKALRAMKVAAQTWDDDSKKKFYLKAAVKMCDEFDGWGGFGAANEGRSRRGSASAGVSR